MIAFFAQMSGACSKCEVAARVAGKEGEEKMYRKKSLEAAAAIIKIYEREQIQAKAALKEGMEMMEMMGSIRMMGAMGGKF